MYTEKMYKALRRDTEGKHNQVTDLLDEIDRLNRYITALENCEVRSKTVVKRLRIQTGMDTLPTPPEGE